MAMNRPLASARLQTRDSDLLCEVFQGDDMYVLRLSNHFGVLAEDAVEDGPTVLARFEAMSQVLKTPGGESLLRAGSPPSDRGPWWPAPEDGALEGTN